MRTAGERERTMDKNIRIDEIVTRLNAASDAYYGGQEEQMTNYEWDALFDELTALEKATGYVRPDSPTQVTSHSGNEMDGEGGEKEAHEYPALSLAKTKKGRGIAGLGGRARHFGSRGSSTARRLWRRMTAARSRAF